MEALKRGDVIGGLIGAPFEIAAGAIDTATMPLSGQKPQWIRDAEVAKMRVDRPKIDDPAWRKKFERELAAGGVTMATFEENLEAYRLTKNEVYLSRAEQLCTSTTQRSALEEQVLRSLGAKAFDLNVYINGQSTTSKFSEREDKVLFISGNVNGAKVHPTGKATMRLRHDLPFKVKDNYRVTVKFKFVIPRESTMYFMGMKDVAKSDSVGVVSRTFTFGPGSTSASTTLDFGQLNGAGTVAVLGSQSKIEVTDRPYTTFDVIEVVKQ